MLQRFQLQAAKPPDPRGPGPCWRLRPRLSLPVCANWWWLHLFANCQPRPSWHTEYWQQTFGPSLGVQMLQSFQLQGPLTPDQGLCPWTRLGALKVWMCGLWDMPSERHTNRQTHIQTCPSQYCAPVPGRNKNVGWYYSYNRRLTGNHVAYWIAPTAMTLTYLEVHFAAWNLACIIYVVN